MTKKDKSRSGQTSDLRRQAEEKAALRAGEFDRLSPEQALKLLHEFRVRQIELETQNEELRQAQVELNAARARALDLYDLAPVGYFLLGDNGLILEANRTVANMLGMDRNDLVNQPLARFIVPEDRDVCYHHSKRVFETAEPQVCEFRMRRAEAEPFWARVEASAALNDAGARVCRAVMSDITERKRAEEALRDSEQRLRIMVDNAADIVTVMDLDLNLLFISPSVERLTGYTVEEAMALGKGALLSRESLERVMEVNRAEYAIADSSPDTPTRTELEIRRKDGSIMFCESIGRYLRRPDRAPYAVVSIVRDITERKLAEQALQESTRIINASPVVIFLWRNAEGWPVDLVTENVINLFGYSAEDFMSGLVRYSATVHPDDIQRVADEVAVYSAKPDCTDFAHQPYRIITSEGRVKWLDDRTSIRRDAQGEITHYQGIVFDITARVQAEQTLLESEEKFALAFKTSPYAITITSPLDGRFIEVNDAFYSITGFTREETQNNSSLEMNLWVNEEDRNQVVTELLAGRRVAGKEFQFKKKNGELITGLFSADLFRIQNTVYILSSINDITERKQADEALRASEQQFRLITENTRDTIWLMDLGFRTTWISPSVVKTRGYTLEELAAMPLDQHVTPESLARMLELSAVHLTPERLADPDAEIVVSVELEYIRKDGSTFWADSTVTLLRDNDGKPTGFLGVGRDVTERKRADIALRESEERYRDLTENIQDMLCTHDLDGKILSANASAVRVTGYSLETLLQMNLRNLLAPDVRYQLDAYLNELRGHGYASGIMKIQTAAGEIRYWEFNNNLRTEGVPFPVVRGMARDITERKQTEKREKLTREILELLNRQQGVSDLVREILLLVKETTGFEAIGIRLQEGEDFPYYETNGFSEEFLQSERRLCAYDEAGKLVRNSAGNPVLECMCGNVICGRIDPSKPFFTEIGSFWTNSTTQLLATTTEADRQTHTRNRCNGEGFESVGLIPLRFGDKIIGLLQLNDHRPNRFTPEMIHFFEGLGASIGIALSRKRAEEALRISEAFLNSIIEHSPHAMWISDSQGTLIRLNQACRDLLHITDEEFVGKYNVLQDSIVIEQGHLPLVKQVFEHGATAKFTIKWESAQLRNLVVKENVPVVLDVTISPVLDADGRVIHAIIQHVDITERVRAEEALRESEETYRLHFANVNDVIYSLDINSCLLSISPSVEKVLGYRPEELIGKPFMDLNVLAPEYLERAVSDTLRVFSGETLSTVEYEFLARDGSRRIGELSSSPIFKDGKVIASTTVARDITERKRADEEIAKNGRLTQALLDLHLLGNAPQEQFLDFIQDASLRITQSAAAFIGLMDEAEAVMTIHRWSPETFNECAIDDKPINYPIVDAGWWGDCVRKRKPILVNDYAVSHPAKQGVPKGHLPIRRFLAIPIFDASRIVAVAAVANKQGDYTDSDIHALVSLMNKLWEIMSRKRAEEALEKKDKQLSNAMEIAHLGPWEYDIAQDLFIFNDHFYKLFRTTAEQVGGYTMSSAEYARRFVHPDDMSLVGQETRKAVETIDPNFSRQIEHRVIFGDGAIGYISVRFYVVKDDQGRTIRTYGVNQDLTEHKLAEKEKEKLEQQLQQSQKMESVGRLAGGVAHDFNNLLTAILGYADVMQRSLNANDPLYKDLNEIIRAGESAAALTKQLLAFSRKQIISTKVLDLNKVVERSKKMISRLIGEDIDLVFFPKPDLWKTKVDPAQIDQVLVNLAVNSRDAMPNGGKLTIDTANAVFDEEYCNNHPGTMPGEFVVLAVSDNGVGMDKETQTRIFEPFYTTKEKEKGTGLGLSMVYGIVKQHGGFVFVYSEPGEGTTFKVYLPRVHEEAETIEEQPASIPVTGSETILLVEDQDMVRRLAKRTLEQSGFRVLEADDGGDAYLICEKYEDDIHLLLTDVVMPNLNGKELYERIANMKPNIKVLYMSGYTENAIAHHGVLDPGIMFIQKPFKSEDLLKKVRETLDAAPSESSTVDSKTAGKILLIDDEESIRIVVSAFLEENKFEVLCAADGKQGLALFEQSAPELSLIILDMTLPDLAGIEILHKIREMRPNVPVIVVSGFGSDEISDILKKEVFVSFLPKPFRKAELTTAIRKSLWK